MTLVSTGAIMYSKKTTKVLKSNAFKSNGVYRILITYKKEVKKGVAQLILGQNMNQAYSSHFLT
jgi:hypothetical protein